MGKRSGVERRTQARGRVGSGWSGEAQGALLGLRDWRAQHPDATLADMEAELDRRWHALRAQILADMALAHRAAEVSGAEVGQRRPCPRCGGRLRDEGEHERTLQTLGNTEVRLIRA